jgi:hypothetical protein
MKNKKRIGVDFKANILKSADRVKDFVIEDFGKMAEEKRIKALTILDGLYKQIENEMIKNGEIDNEQYYILINHEDLYDLYKATDLFVDIYGIIVQGIYGEEKRLLGFKLLVCGDIKKPEIVRKLK